MQLGISEGTAEYRGATLEQRKCEEKGEAEGNYSVLTLNLTCYIPVDHLVRTMVFWSEGLMISLRKGGRKGVVLSFFSLFPTRQISNYLFILIGSNFS